MGHGVRYRVGPVAVSVPDQVLAAPEHQAGHLLCGHARHNGRPRRSRRAEPFLQVHRSDAGGAGMQQAGADSRGDRRIARVSPDGQTNRRACGSVGVCGRRDGGRERMRSRCRAGLQARRVAGSKDPAYITSVLVLAAVATLSAQTPAGKTHRLEATPQTVAYGYYDAAAPPVLTIDSGDIIDVDTLLTNVPDRLERAGVPPNQVQESLRRIVTEVPQNRRGPGGHILTGPVFVRGAEPGDTLEVSVLSISLPIAYGYNGCSGFLRDNCEPGRQALILPLDAKRMIATFPGNVEIPLKPFFGSMGVAPPPPAGRISSNPPWIHAGNLDNKELVAGSTLFIPVFARGALFEIGDGHAAQGDGEVDQTAIETSLRGRVRLTVRKDMKLEWPRAETAADFISMAADPDLKVATSTAIQEMVDFLVASKRLSKHEAYQLVSVAGNVAITQLVDRPNVGVHVRLPKSIFK